MAAKKAQKERLTSLADIPAMIAKRYGSDALATRGSFVKMRAIQRISTGIFDLDRSLGGGIPRGRNACIWGPPGVGKSTLCAKIIAQHQRHCRICGQQYKDVTWEFVKETVNKQGEVTTVPCAQDIATGVRQVRTNCGCPDGIGQPMKAAFIAVERGFDPLWMAAQGVNLDELFLFEPEFGEQAVDMVVSILETYDCDLITIDSMSQLTPSAELEGEAGDQQMMVQPRLIGKAMRLWAPFSHSIGPQLTKTTILTTNQVRVNVKGNGGFSFMGGKSYEHNQDIIIRLSKPMKDSAIKLNDTMQVGQNIEYKIVKNRTGQPFRAGSYALYTANDPRDKPLFHQGDTNHVEQVLLAATQWGLAQRASNGVYTIPGIPQTIRGVPAAIRLFAEQPEKLVELERLVWSCEQSLSNGGIPMPPDLLRQIEVEEVVEVSDSTPEQDDQVDPWVDTTNEE